MIKHRNKNHHYNTKNFAELCRNFIDWDKRRKGENGFLKNILLKHRCKHIFESSLGDGCDSIYLIKEGFDVASNEIDVLFVQKAKKNAEKEKVKLKITSFDWRDVNSHFKEGQFDAVLCLGNSLTCLFGEQDQLKTLQNFYFLLRKRGILIIDERNYQYFLDDAKNILKGNFRYSGKYVYCGTRVHGYPIEIEENKIVMEYNDNKTGKKAHLVLYPFKKGELFSLLKQTGFRKIVRYSDFKKGFDKNADFYQYIAIK